MLALKKTIYEQLLALPDDVTGEILNGQLYAHPRPNAKHVVVATNLGFEVGGPYHKGRGGPGGWWILDEPEIHFELDREVVVPDLAGWRRERMPELPNSHKFQVVPDWICEVLSPSTESVDRQIKMTLYAKYGVSYLWLIDPAREQLEVYVLDGDSLELSDIFRGDQVVNADPFPVLRFKISDLLS